MMNYFISYSAALRSRVAAIFLSGFLLFMLPFSAAAQDIGWSPDTMFFDSTVIGTTATQTLTLTNLDDVLPMSVNSIEWTYNEPGEVTWTPSFVFVADRPVPATLLPGGSMEIDITFRAESFSFKAANMLITNDSLNAPSLNYYVMGDGVEGNPFPALPAIISYLLSDTATATPQEIAIDKIKAYADNQANPVPTIQDYINAGVTGVTEENIDDVNSIVASKMASEVDTTEKIQAVVDSVVNAVSFESDVMPIFEDNCQSCHTTTSKRTFKVGDTAYTHNNIITNSLINIALPDESAILLKGNGISHNGGDQLSDVNSQIVRDWIAEGGLNN